VRFYRSDARKGKAFHDNRRMLARLSAFVIWSLVAASAAFWALRLAASAPQVPPYAVVVGNSVAVRGDLGRLFGAPQRSAAAAQPTPEAPSRFRLIGVMAPRSGAMQTEPGGGVALIAVDGKPARPYAVGARLDSDLILQSVGLRTASLGPAQGARSVLLELPALPPPNSGVLPPVGTGAPLTPAPSFRTVPPAVPAVGAGIAPPPQPPIQPLPPMAPPVVPSALPTNAAPPSDNGRSLTQ
jgi:general secretion pathway protein C